MGQLILVIDDSEFNLKVVRGMLNEFYQVECANSGEAALAFLAEKKPDLIILDLHMPEMDGFEVMKRLKADSVWKEIPVVMLTADSDRGNEVRCFEMGAMDFITKPIVGEVMLQRVGRILKLTRLQRFLEFEVEEQTKRAEERRKQVEQLSEEIMKTLASTIDAKDRYTNGHSLRVAMYSKEIARRCGMSKREQKEIYHMGLLHDIGKIGVPDTIINKCGKLSEEEYDTIRQHPVIGSDILRTIEQIPDIMIGARWHHERFDGTGYPDGLKGLEIPEYARIIGVADAYDAMTSKRSYRDILPQDVVRSELENGKGSQFDPVFAEVMIQMIDDDIRYTMREKDRLPKSE